MNIVLVMDRIENALLNTFLGMGTVFVVLVIIIFFISLLGFIPKLKSSKNVNKDEKNSSETYNKSEEEINNSQKSDILLINEDNLTKDKELVAAIIAAITAYLGDEAPKDGLVVRSIKRANVENWKRS